MEENIFETAKQLLDEKQFSELRALFAQLEPADLASLLDEFETERLLVLFRILPKELAAETFVEMDSDMQMHLIQSFTDNELRDVVSELYLDDTVDIIEEMPASVVTRLLSHADAETRRSINQLLHYPKDSAGSIMTIEFVSLRPTMTVHDAFERIRRTGVDKETIYTCYVTDDKRKLIGVVTAKTLLLSDEDALIEDIMETNVISVATGDDKEIAADHLRKYDFLALPVVDLEDRLVGIVTVDDAIDVLTEEATEDMEMMAAITPTDKPYLKTSVFEMWKKRIPWLLLLMLSATFTGKIIQHFESALASYVILTSFIPMLMGTGGNAGGQASVTIIRGLSLGEVRARDILTVMWKEIRVALLCGVILAGGNFAKMLWLDGIDMLVAAVVSLTLLATVLIAKVIGASLPILAKCIRLDPAVMASPFITTLVDTLSLVIYFRVAGILLGI